MSDGEWKSKQGRFKAQQKRLSNRREWEVKAKPKRLSVKAQAMIDSFND